jgi:hypothetical protein
MELDWTTDGLVATSTLEKTEEVLTFFWELEFGGAKHCSLESIFVESDVILTSLIGDPLKFWIKSQSKTS